MPPDSPLERSEREAAKRRQAWDDVRLHNRWSQLDVALGRKPQPVSAQKQDLIVDGIVGSFTFLGKLIVAIITLLCIPAMLIALVVGVPAMIIFLSTASPGMLLAVIVIMLIFP